MFFLFKRKKKDNLEKALEVIEARERVKRNYGNPFQPKSDWKDIIEVLRVQFDLPFENVEEILNKAKSEGLTPFAYLVQKGYLDTEEVYKFWSEKYQIPYDRSFIPTRFINRKFLNRVAEFIEGRGEISDREIAIYSPFQLEKAQKKFEGKDIVFVNYKIFENLKLLVLEDNELKIRAEILDLLKKSLKSNAIHFVESANQVFIFERSFGRLYKVKEIGKGLYRKIIELFAKEVENGKIYYPEFNLTVKIYKSENEGKINLVLKLLKSEDISFSELGFLEEDKNFLLNFLKSISRENPKIVAIKGGIESGKTTTLKTIGKLLGIRLKQFYIDEEYFSKRMFNLYAILKEIKEQDTDIVLFDAFLNEERKKLLKELKNLGISLIFTTYNETLNADLVIEQRLFNVACSNCSKVEYYSFEELKEKNGLEFFKALNPFPKIEIRLNNLNLDTEGKISVADLFENITQAMEDEDMSGLEIITDSDNENLAENLKREIGDLLEKLWLEFDKENKKVVGKRSKLWKEFLKLVNKNKEIELKTFKEFILKNIDTEKILQGLKIPVAYPSEKGCKECDYKGFTGRVLVYGYKTKNKAVSLESVLAKKVKENKYIVY